MTIHSIIFILYAYVTSIILSSTSLWTLYFGFELLWMLLLYYFFNANSFFKGIINYIIVNGILGIVLLFGIITNNSMCLVFSVIGKIGFWPFLLIFITIYNCCSYSLIIYDSLNKIVYLISIIVILRHSITFNTFLVIILLINIFITSSFLKFSMSIKLLILLSSLLNIIFILLLILMDNQLFSFNYLICYSITAITLLFSLITTSYHYNYYIVNDMKCPESFISWSYWLIILLMLLLYSIIPMSIMFYIKIILLLCCSSYSITIGLIIAITIIFMQCYIIRIIVCIL